MSGVVQKAMISNGGADGAVKATWHYKILGHRHDEEQDDQQPEQHRIRKLTVDMNISSMDCDALSSFLSSGSGHTPQSGEITGILKEMKDIMKKKLATAMDEDNAFITNFNSLVVAKEKEIASNSEVIESKTTRLNEVGVTIVIMKEDLNDIIKALIENKKFL
eukprot:12675939-Heterocapsa_arctica.AAC.1